MVDEAAVLDGDTPIQRAFRQLDCHLFMAAIAWVNELPYGRNTTRDYRNVLIEHRGTCSSKHALLAALAQELGLDHWRLTLGMYKMNAENTPRVGKVLEHYGVEYLPEAHTYLTADDRRIDVTASNSTLLFVPDLLEEQFIDPEQVAEWKVAYHRKYMKSWLQQQELSFDFERVWSIREECIAALS